MISVFMLIIFIVLIVLPLACVAKACIKYLFNLKPKKEIKKDEDNNN